MKTAMVGIAAVAALALAAAAVGFVPEQQRAQPAAAAAPAARVVKPSPAPAPAPLRLPAIAEPAEEASLHARVAGFIAERRVELGDAVAAGQVLALIDAPEQEHEARRLRAALAEAGAQARLKTLELERGEQLVAQNHISRAALDSLRAQAEVAAAAREAVRAELARVNELLAFRQVRAPFAGRVVERRAERGDLVAADQPQAGYLFRVARIDTLRLVVDLPQSALAGVGVGTAAQAFFPGFTEAAVAGEVTRLAGLVERRSGTMRVEVSIPNPGGRIPAGLAGQVEFAPADAAPAWRLPLGAVTQRGGAPHLAVVREGRAHFVAVRLGRNLGSTVEVLSGVDADTAVIVNPNGLLGEGDAVAELIF